MNNVGKILVLLIMVASIIFAGTATVVFSTFENYKVEIEKKDQNLRKVTDEKATEAASRKIAEDDLAKAKADAKAQLADQSTRLTALEERIKTSEDTNKDQASNLQVAQQTLLQAQNEEKVRVREANTLRDVLKKLESETNDLKILQQKQNVTIRELELKLETAVRQNQTLLADNAAYGSWLRSKGFDGDISTIRGISAPPQVEGRILRVDVTNSRVEFSLGSDDGLKPGHEMYVFRTSPPEFLCKIKVVETAPDKSSAVVVGKTFQGKRLMEGDNVATKIPRGL